MTFTKNSIFLKCWVLKLPSIYIRSGSNLFNLRAVVIENYKRPGRSENGGSINVS